MWLSSWLRRHESRDRRPRHALRPFLECLEDRTTPAAVLWDGGGGDFNWHNALNWSADALPGATDDAVIGSSFAGITVTSSLNATINSVQSEAGLTISGGSFSISLASALNNNLT